MKFQDSRVKLRLRTPDEAVDVGVLLARKYWWSVIGSWAVFAIPVFFVSCFIPYTFWAIVFFWWFKPLYERLPLQTVSSAIFLQKHSFKSALKGVFQYDTLAWLTLYRFCPGRSTLTPIAVLEGMDSGSGKIRKRRRLVKSPIISTYMLLHAGMFLCEFIIVTFGLFLYMYYLKPVLSDDLLAFELQSAQWSWIWNSQTSKVLILGLALAASALMAPFYVCAGFALYINRRISLEGWDLYLGFHKLISRVSVACLALLVVVPSLSVMAQESTHNIPTTPNSRIEVRAEVEEIVQEHIVYEKTFRDFPDIQTTNTNFLAELLGDLLYVLGWLIVLLLIGVILGLIIWVLIKLRVWEFVKRRTYTQTVAKPEVSVIEDGQNEIELPSNVVAEANRAWQEGRPRDALSLLYRGALLYLIAKYACPIRICDTERTCTRVIARRVPSLSAVFNKLSLHWQQVAYGKKMLADQEFRQLLVLYDESFA